MKILMIHEIKDWMLDLDLSEFDMLTFDDGLFSQYRHYKHFLKFNKPMYFFISTDIVCQSPTAQPLYSVCCSDAHKEYFEYGSKRYYMTWDQIKEIDSTTNCFIGGHSHTHPKLTDMNITAKYDIVNKECKDMISTFRDNNIKIKSFCYPYNDEVPFYKGILVKHGVTKYFGKNRIKIEDLK